MKQFLIRGLGLIALGAPGPLLGQTIIGDRINTLKTSTDRPIAYRSAINYLQKSESIE